MNNVFRNELLSEKWCNLVFEGRNRDYGAYRLRAEAGLRYCRALVGVALLVGVFLIFVGYRVAVDYLLLKSLDGEMPMARMKPLKPEEGHELKAIAAGRSKSLPTAGPDASTAVPEIAETAPLSLEFGIEGPKVIDTEEQTLVRLPDDSLRHNEDREDLPEEGDPLTPVQVVEEMPQYPGGLKALMAFLDANILYPPACQKAGLEGVMEVAFYVDEHGRVLDPQVSKSLNAAFDRAALEAVRKMPAWKPGKRGGRATIVRVRIPVRFQLQ